MTDLAGLAVTGSSGVLGGMVARQLAEAGFPQRLLVRDAGRAPELDNAPPVLVSYADPVLSRPALEGVKTLFMVSAAEAEDRLQQHYAFVDAAAAAGVQHIVYTSFFGAAPDCTFTLARDHYATEERIRASGMAFTFLRNNFYLDFLPTLAGEDGVIRGPARDGVMAAVAREDIARSAVAVLGILPCMPGSRTTSRARRTSRWRVRPRCSPDPSAGPSRTTTKPWRRRTPPGPRTGLRRGWSRHG